MILAWWRARQDRRARAIQMRQAAEWHLSRAKGYDAQAASLRSAKVRLEPHDRMRYAMELGATALNHRANAERARAGGDHADAMRHIEAADAFSTWHRQEVERVNWVRRMNGEKVA